MATLADSRLTQNWQRLQVQSVGKRANEGQQRNINERKVKNENNEEKQGFRGVSRAIN